MFYTTVIWEVPPLESMSIEFQRKADEIAGDFQATKLLDNHQDGSVTATRTWPTQEAAEAWVEFILQHNPVSAVVAEE